MNRFESVNGWLSFEHNGWKYFLCHFPVYSWHHKERGAIHIHGHTHGMPTFEHPRKLDVSVEAVNYIPVALDDVPKLLGLMPKIVRTE